MNTDMSDFAPPTLDTTKAVSHLWTVKACAAYLQKSPRWLWSALRHRPESPGSIPHVRVGSSPRFLPEDIAAWVRQNCPPAATFIQWRDTEKKRQNRPLLT